MLVRLLRNLKAIYTDQKAWLKALCVTDHIICVTPGLAEEYRDRGIFYVNLECFRAAQFDLQVYLKMLPTAQDADSVRSRLVEVQSVAARLN
jgi:regulator of sirC expression with transglutaminase-like and TPR domain